MPNVGHVFILIYTIDKGSGQLNLTAAQFIVFECHCGEGLGVRS